MPVLQLLLERLTQNGPKNKLVLPGGISKQPLILKHYIITLANIYLTSAVAAPGFEPLPIGTLLIQLPFLNTYDVNTNCVVQNAIVLPIGYDSTTRINGLNTEYYNQVSGMMDILFNPARNVLSEFDNFEVYDYSGDVITSPYSITLMFEYRRPDLI